MLDQPQATDPAAPGYVDIDAGMDDTSLGAPHAQASAADFEVLRDLTRLARADLSRDDRLRNAVALAARLLPAAARLRLFLPRDQADAAFDVLEAGTTLAQAAHTLGYGEQADQEVLQQQRVVRQPNATLMPLPGAELGPCMVLVVDWRPHTPHSQAETRVSLVAEQLAMLLAVSEREQREKQLAATLEQQSQTFDAFISMTAHELRSPLTSIKGYAQLLVRQATRTGLPETALHSAEAIVEQSTRLAEMIEQIHDAARIRRGKLEMHSAPTDLVALVREQAEEWPAAFPRHTIQLSIADNSLVGEWDAYRVAQVIHHLVENAARYSAADAHITVEIERRDGEAVIAVCDEGIGIPEEDQAHVFEYLYRSPTATARNLTGLGLGLFVSAQLVERMGGRLWLRHSATGPAHGSEFCFALPLSA